MTGPCPPPDPRFDRLLARYWDGTLTAAEFDELNARLETDPAARHWFRTWCFQAGVTNEWAAVRRPPEPAAPRMSRRRLLAGFGAGAAVGLTGGLLAAYSLTRSPRRGGAKLVWARGQVLTGDRQSRLLAVGGAVPAGTAVATVGENSAAVLECADGSRLNLSADTTVAVDDVSHKVWLLRGAVTADLKSATGGAPPLTLATRVAALTPGGGVAVAACCAADATEFQVESGRAKVSDGGGVHLSDVSGGELFTVRADGRHSKQPIPTVPDTLAVTPAQPLSAGWAVGGLEPSADGPLLSPAFWFDPYHSAVLSQIRSNNAWTRGLVRIYPDSEVSVRYRANRPAFGEVVLVVRPLRDARGATGCLTWNGRFEATPVTEGRLVPVQTDAMRVGEAWAGVSAEPAAEWRTLAVRADAMLGGHNKHTPEFDPPWVAFLLIFNTFDADIGLRVADLRVSRPEGS